LGTAGASLLAAGLLAPTEARAQAPAAGVADGQDIIVTARKREESILDVPAAVTAVSAQSLEELGGVVSVNDIGYLLPGIAFVNTGNINSEINIRGAGAGTARVTGVDSPIAVLRNGVSITGGNIGGRTFTRTDLFDLQRIEVIRGPQGSLFGVNAVGGVMNVVSQRPRAEQGLRVSAGYTFETERIEGEAIGNLPLSPSLAVRFGYQHAERGNGFFRNVVTGKAGDIENYDGGRIGLLWTPSPAFELYASLDVANDVSSSNRVRNIGRVNDPLLPANQIPPPDPDGPFRFGHNTSNRVDRDLVNAFVELKAEAPFGDVISWTQYRSRETDFLQDEDGSAPGYAQLPFPAATCATRSCITNFTDSTDIFSQELRVESRGSNRLTWLVGLNMASRTTEFATISDGRTTSATNLNPSPTANTASAFRDTDFQVGLFGDLGLAIGERGRLTVAGRYNHAEKTLRAYTVPRSPATGVLCPYLDPFRGLQGADPRCIRGLAISNGSFDNFAPSASFQFRARDNWNLFVTAAYGYRAGGFNANAISDPAILPTFDPEKSIAAEIGTKFEALGARWTITGFYNDFDNLLVTVDSIGPDNVTRNWRLNAGKAETYGVDFEMVGSIGRRDGPTFTYTAAVNWLDGQILEGPYAGQTVEGSPEWTISLNGTLRLPVGGDWTILGSGAWRAQRGGFFSTTQISNRIPNADIDLFEARLAAQSRRYRLELVVQNLTDLEYETLRDLNRSVYGDRRSFLLRGTVLLGSEEAGR
jgi:iron complex outermembrane receptor protein